MYYEYFVTDENGERISINSDKVNLSVVSSNYPTADHCECCGKYNGVYYESYNVDFCLIHEGTLPNPYAMSA